MDNITVADVEDLLDAIEHIDSPTLQSIYISLTENEQHWLEDKENILWLTNYIKNRAYYA